MAEVKLGAQRREDTGKGAARRARAAGKVPGVVYGLGIDPIAVEVDRREFVTALHGEGGFNTLLNLQIDGSSTLTLTKNLQRDPVRGTLLHVDFVKVDAHHDVEVEVPLNLVGEAPGATAGGVVEQPLFTLHVRCRPADVPDAIEADISSLQIGDSLRVGDIASGRNFEILNDPELPVVTIAAPITEEQLEQLEADAVAVAQGPEVPTQGAAETPTEQAERRGDTAPDEIPDEGS